MRKTRHKDIEEGPPTSVSDSLPKRTMAVRRSCSLQHEWGVGGVAVGDNMGAQAGVSS